MIRTKKVAITGASGMVGYALGLEAVKRGYEVLALARTDRHLLPGVRFHPLDLTKHERVAEVITHFGPDLLIHGAAMTSQSECEANPRLAHELHVDATANIAKLMADHRGHLVHLSTEAVYGNGPRAHVEEDECKPIGIYATTKLMGEEEVMRKDPQALILRVTPVGLSPNGQGRSLVEWLLDSFGRGQEVVGFTDVFFTPITSFQLASFIFDFGHDLHGTYNWGCADPISKFEFSSKLAQAVGFRAEAVRKGRRYTDGSEHHGEMRFDRLARTIELLPVFSTDVIANLGEKIPILKYNH